VRRGNGGQPRGQRGVERPAAADRRIDARGRRGELHVEPPGPGGAGLGHRGDGGQRRDQRRREDKAVRHRHDPVRPAAVEAHHGAPLAAAPRRQHRAAAALRGRDMGQPHRRVRQARPRQFVPHPVDLPAGEEGVARVLERAAAAVAGMGAGRRHALGRGGDQARRMPFKQHRLARQEAVEFEPPRRTGQHGPAGGIECLDPTDHSAAAGALSVPRNPPDWRAQ
jgi:hypothetical protein